MIAVTRCYQLSAAHVLRNPAFSDAENRRTYGQCANPKGHGHNYGIEVTVTGPLDAETGRIVEPELLDAIVEERVLGRLDHRLLNDVPLFEKRVPTAENIARAVHDELQGPISERSGARLLRVRVLETSRNSFDCGEMP